MKIVLVQPNVGFGGHTWEAQGLGYIGAYIKKFIDADIEFFSGFYDLDNKIINACKDADFVGFSCTSPQMRHALHLSRMIKEINPQVMTVFGGCHPSALPKETSEYNEVDTVVVGEGECAFLKIIKSSEKCSIVNEGYVENIDSLPFIDRKLIKNERNIKTAYKDNKMRITSIFSSRGCPFNCVFCASNVIWGKGVRFRSPDNVLSEMDTLINEWSIDFIKFSDDTFVINKKRILEFCQKKSSFKLDIPFGCNARVDAMNKEIFEALSKAGCEELWFGVESGNPSILHDMKKGITLEQIKKSFELAKKFGIKTRAYCLIGMPNDTYDTIKDTEKLLDEIEPDHVGFTILAPYPGTTFYNDSFKDIDWSEVDEYSNNITKTKYLSNEQLKREQERLVEKYQNKAVFRQRKK